VETGEGDELTEGSALSWPGKRRQQVTPGMAADTKWLRSP
jgi:hypothetical protein